MESSTPPITLVAADANSKTKHPSRLERAGSLLRRTARGVLAWMFWLHAIGVTHLIRFHLSLTEVQRAEFIEGVLFAFIFTYSILAANGWWSLLFDLAYIIAYPAWVVIRLLWKLIKQTVKSPIFDSFRSAATTAAAAVDDGHISQETSTSLQWLREKCLRPFQNFAVAWCLITLTSSNQIIKIVGLCALFGTLARLIYSFVVFVHGSVGFLGRMEERLRIQVEAAFDKVLNTSPETPDFLSHVRVLKFLVGVFRRFSKRESLEAFMRTLTLCTAGPYYLYLSILFGFFYYGVSTVSGHDWALSDAIVTAIAIPFSFTDLPHESVIRLVAWIQCLLPLFVGFETLLRRMDEKTQALVLLASRLEEYVARSDVKARFEMFEQSRKQPKSVDSPVQSATMASGAS